MNPTITKVEPTIEYFLKLTFSNGEVKMFDINPYFEFETFHGLKDITTFNQVELINGTVCWNEELDFCPDMLYTDSKPINS